MRQSWHQKSLFLTPDSKSLAWQEAIIAVRREGTTHPSDRPKACMSKFDIPTLTASCPACKLKSIHRVVLENTDVRHLRCDACDAAHVCAAKGSYQAAIHALAFEDLEKVARQGAVEAYSIRSAYHPMGGFEHPKFGLGYVFAILSPPKKMEVVFSDKVRFLVCGPGSGVTKSESEEEAPEGDQAVASNTAPDNSSADGPPAGSADGEAHS